MYAVSVWTKEEQLGTVVTRKRIPDGKFLDLIEKSFFEYLKDIGNSDEADVDEFVSFHNTTNDVKIEQLFIDLIAED